VSPEVFVLEDAQVALVADVDAADAELRWLSAFAEALEDVLAEDGLGAERLTGSRRERGLGRHGLPRPRRGRLK
jgi:hypothetical protein